ASTLIPGSPVASVVKLTVASRPSPVNGCAPMNTASTTPGRGESTRAPASATFAPGVTPDGRTLAGSHVIRIESPFTWPVAVNVIGHAIVSPTRAAAPASTASALPAAAGTGPRAAGGAGRARATSAGAETASTSIANTIRSSKSITPSVSGSASVV